jgi:hypothetical protein
MNRGLNKLPWVKNTYEAGDKTSMINTDENLIKKNDN